MLPILSNNNNNSSSENKSNLYVMSSSFRMDDDFNVNNATEEELKEYIHELESELEFYKPMFIA